MTPNDELQRITGLPIHSVLAWKSDEEDQCEVLGWGWFVYQFVDAVDTYYVGRARDIRRRLKEHRRAGLGHGATSVHVWQVTNEQASINLEAQLIRLYDPQANSAKPAMTAIDRWWYQKLAWAVFSHGADDTENLGYDTKSGNLLVWWHGVYLPALPTEERHHWSPEDGLCWIRVAADLVRGLMAAAGVQEADEAIPV